MLYNIQRLQRVGGGGGGLLLYCPDNLVRCLAVFCPAEENIIQEYGIIVLSHPGVLTIYFPGRR